MRSLDAALPRPTRDLAQARDDLERHGLALIPEALGREELAAVRVRLAEQAAGERAAGIACYDSGNGVACAEPRSNQRVYNLISKGAEFRELVLKPWLLELMRHLLGPDLLLSNLFANITGPGGRMLGMHSDQIWAPPDTPHALVANAIWMLDDFREEVGATRVVPGSHLLRDHPDRDWLRQVSVPAEAPAGTALVYDGRLWHATGAHTSRTGHRHGIISYFSRPFIRGQENWALSVPPDVLAGASSALLDLLGFRVWMTLGSVQGPWGTPPRGQPPGGVFVSRAAPFVGELDARGSPRRRAA
jgi:ectoine hydroxylase-related dioxygenase (phytanoyl-CoA dioxygenase family)